jgi:hypothetical protein
MDGTRFDRLTRGLTNRTTRRTALGATLAGLGLGLTGKVSAQEATPPPVAEGEKPVFMFVQTFAAGRGEINPGAGTPTVDGTPTPAGGASLLLTLEGHSGQTIYFSDRPDRVVGVSPTDDLLEGLGFSLANPPNAALVAEFETGQGVVVLELIEPTYDAETGTLVYGAEVLEGYTGEYLIPVLADQVAERLPVALGPGALFIDDCPDITGCYMVVAGHSLTCGPIPGGPYGQCWDPMWSACYPCSDTWGNLSVPETWAYLNGLCQEAYGSCFAG